MEQLTLIVQSITLQPTMVTLFTLIQSQDHKDQQVCKDQKDIQVQLEMMDQEEMMVTQDLQEMKVKRDIEEREEILVLEDLMEMLDQQDMQDQQDQKVIKDLKESQEIVVLKEYTSNQHIQPDIIDSLKLSELLNLYWQIISLYFYKFVILYL